MLVGALRAPEVVVMCLSLCMDSRFLYLCRRAVTLLPAYLVAYNIASALGWAIILRIGIDCLRRGDDAATFYDSVQWYLKVVQTAAVLEVLHALLGKLVATWMCIPLKLCMSSLYGGLHHPTCLAGQ